MKNGKMDFMLTFAPALLLSFFVLINARTSVIGMIASVLVSLTVTALSNVCDPSENIESHVEAAAVTDEVSLTAVPAKIPNASGVGLKPRICAPRDGNIMAASTLKKKITELD